MVNVSYIILGCIVLFVPGFLLSLLFYPRRKDLDFWERVGVSFGFGVLTAVFVAVVVAQPSLKMLKAAPFFALLFALSAVFAAVAYWRGSLGWVIGLFRELRPRPKPEPPREQPPPERPASEQPTPERPPLQRPTPERPEQPSSEEPASEYPSPGQPAPEGRESAREPRQEG